MLFVLISSPSRYNSYPVIKHIKGDYVIDSWYTNC